jgi:hypothetical protein
LAQSGTIGVFKLPGATTTRFARTTSSTPSPFRIVTSKCIVAPAASTHGSM